MKSNNDIDLLTNLINTLNLLSKKIEESYNNKDLEELKKTKEEILKIQKRIGEVL